MKLDWKGSSNDLSIADKGGFTAVVRSRMREHGKPIEWVCSIHARGRELAGERFDTKHLAIGWCETFIAEVFGPLVEDAARAEREAILGEIILPRMTEHRSNEERVRSSSHDLADLIGIYSARCDEAEAIERAIKARGAKDGAR